MIGITEFDVIPAGMELANAEKLPPAILATSTGLDITDELSFPEWQGIGRNFGSALQAAAWCIGDWLVYGENKWGKQMSLKGEGFDEISSSRIGADSYALAIQSTGLDLGTLKVYASVCRAIPKAERHPGLTFAHHQTLAPLPVEKRKEWMKVVKSDLIKKPSVKRLRLSVRIAGDSPRIVSDEEIKGRGEVGHDNYIPHLTRLITILRKTTPDMTEHQREALKEDCAQLVELLEAL